MYNKLRVIGALILVVEISSKSSAYSYYDNYNIYNTGYHNYQQYYPQQTNQYYQQESPITAGIAEPKYNNYQQPQQQQQQQQQYYPQQNTQNYNNQQQSATVWVSEAEWVCTNPKTNNMIIITSEDGLAPRGAQQVQWQQVYPQQSQQQSQPSVQSQPTYIYPQAQANNPQPQQTYPQAQGTNPQQPQAQQIYPQAQVTNPQPQKQSSYQKDYYSTVDPDYTTTEISSGPIWDVVGNELPGSQTNQKYQSSTKPTDPLWPANNNNNKPGFTVVMPTPKPHTTTEDFHDRPVWSDVEPPKKPQQSTTQGIFTQASKNINPIWHTVEPFKKPQTSTKAPANKPIWPEMEPPEKPSGQGSNNPDDDTIQIVMGKK